MKKLLLLLATCAALVATGGAYAGSGHDLPVNLTATVTATDNPARPTVTITADSDVVVQYALSCFTSQTDTSLVWYSQVNSTGVFTGVPVGRWCEALGYKNGKRTNVAFLSFVSTP